MSHTDYRPYKGIPPVAGVCSVQDAMKTGLSVTECVRRLKRYHYAFKRLHQIFTARITAEPIYELKSAFSLHAYICAEHATALRKRVGEMREPPLGLDAVPDTSLEVFFDEILSAPTTEELIAGIYEKAVPALQEAMQRHLADTNVLVDHPSARICRFALLELADVRAFGDATLKGTLIEAPAREKMSGWLKLLDQALAAAGTLDGTKATGAPPVVTAKPAAPTVAATPRMHSAKPYVFDGTPRRDERFPDPYNMGVHAEQFLYDEKYPAQPKTLMMYYKRLREIDVPEMMASIITETKGKPWGYYNDMSRQLWDEARHAMMGEVGFINLGVDWRKVMINFTWSYCLNTQLKPIERHAVLYFIEQGLMPKTGKRFEWEVASQSNNPLAALFQDYDWADEVLHARIGRDWYVSDFKDPKEATKYGDECWSRVMVGWKEWRDQGLTKHRNWWPDVYQEACAKWGIQPDPAILAYNTTYEATRADLKDLSVSG